MKSRKLLMIPGPIEFEPEVMQSMAIPTPSHVDPNFIETFGHCLEMMREVWLCPTGQPFIIAGSGTLAMDMAAANLVEPNDNVLVVSTGYFGERYADLLGRYGANVEILRAQVGDIVPLERVEEKLKSKKYKLMTFTHVDTSTAVINDAKSLGELGKRYEVLTILDGVCSVAGEEIQQENWGIDVVITASQKAIGVPPGLALLVASSKAIEVFKKRNTKVGNYYCDWTNWLPIMQSYENRKPSYFGTPAVNLVMALELSLKQILNEGMEKRFERHIHFAKSFQNSLDNIGLKMLPKNSTVAANTLSAPFFPEDINGAELLGKISQGGIILAGGLLPEIKSKYFRIGHMGVINRNDIISTMSTIESALKECNHKFDYGMGVKCLLDRL